MRSIRCQGLGRAHLPGRTPHCQGWYCWAALRLSLCSSLLRASALVWLSIQAPWRWAGVGASLSLTLGPGETDTLHRSPWPGRVQTLHKLLVHARSHSGLPRQPRRSVRNSSGHCALHFQVPWRYTVSPPVSRFRSSQSGTLTRWEGYASHIFPVPTWVHSTKTNLNPRNPKSKPLNPEILSFPLGPKDGRLPHNMNLVVVEPSIRNILINQN